MLHFLEYSRFLAVIIGFQVEFNEFLNDRLVFCVKSASCHMFFISALNPETLSIQNSESARIN